MVVPTFVIVSLKLLMAASCAFKATAIPLCEPKTGIGIRLLPRPELALQIVELFIDIQRRLQERGNIR